MGKRKWIPVAGQKIVDTERYRYVIGIYSHAIHGDRCFRISKFIRANGYFVGHFVVLPEDQEIVLGEIEQYIQSLMRDGDFGLASVEQADPRVALFKNRFLPGLGPEETR